MQKMWKNWKWAVLGIFGMVLSAGCSPGSSNPWNCGLEEPGCQDDVNETVCKGKSVVTNPCKIGQVCMEGHGCVQQVCNPEAAPVCIDQYTQLECVAPGGATRTQACESGGQCQAGMGCMAPVCSPQDKICLDEQQIGLCRDDRTGFDYLRSCADEGWGLRCSYGECVSACEFMQSGDSSLGREYYAVDLPQFGSSLTDKDYGIIVSNPSSSPAQVQIETTAGVVQTLDIPANELRVYSVLPPREQNISNTGVYSKAYRISSTTPVAAFQFNCLTTVGAASTDASLLFHTGVLARKYWVMDYTGFRPGNFIAVTATEPDTTVTIVPTRALSGSAADSEVSFGPTGAGGTLTVTLNPYQVLVVMASESGVSLTGSSVEASAPVGVFGGNDCTQVPLGTSYCDHLEQQMFPRQAIGNRYVVAKTHPRRNCDPADYVRVLADDDDTVVEVAPAVAGPFYLNAGEWAEFSISQSVEINSNSPVLVGQFLRSSGGAACDNEGDPAFILQVPVEQYRCSYVFLTPDTYNWDFINIVAPLGAQVRLDGEFVTLSMTPVGTGQFTVTSIAVSQGPHVLESDQLVGVIVYGYGGPGSMYSTTQNVSYGYPAGLSMRVINPVE